MRRLLVPIAVLIVVGASLSTTSASARRADITDPNELVRVSRSHLDYYWRSVLARHGKPYASVKGVYWYTRPTQIAGCVLRLQNASYCPSTGSIYLDYGWIRRIVQSDRADFAAAAIVAHEWGHYVQDRLGWLSWAISRRYYIGKELQADCYAGMFARYADQRGLLEIGDLDEAAALMIKLGDDPRAPSHGSPAQRLGWFLVGYREASLNRCNSVYNSLYG